MASGDIAWILTASALVMLMTPALGFFYGGLVRKKNLVSTIVQCFTIFAVISIVWVIFGYSEVFGTSIGGVIGFTPGLLALNGLGTSTVNIALAPSIPELLFVSFQLKFAAITPALIIGATAERFRFKSLLIFMTIWFGTHLVGYAV
jgi:Amt family ammonium transporter